MPEGDTLYKIAEQVRPVLLGQRLTDAASCEPELSCGALIGLNVTAVEARGKHLMIDLSDGRVIHSHLGMTGSWHVYGKADPWRKSPHRATLALSTSQHVVVCFSAKLMEIVSATRLRRNDYVQRLGPDLMKPTFRATAVLPRLRIHDQSPLGEAVMNQTIAAGIGNVYKSESLFLTHHNPWTTVGELSDHQLLDYLALTQKLMLRNRGAGMRTTRFAADGRRVWVYGRRGDACYLCGETVHMRRQGDAGRSTYWCPRCQPATNNRSPKPNSDAHASKPPIRGCS